MDVALFGPYINPSFKWSIFEWFGMIHGIPVKIVIQRLENLKKKSLLENLGDGFDRIGMHDLWREFARLETKAGEFEKRRWMFEWDKYNMLEEANVTNGGPLVDVRRMFFLDKGFMKLEDVSFLCFPYVTVLKLSPQLTSLQELNLRGLKHLKSLELKCLGYQAKEWKTFISPVGLSSLLKLVFLRWLNIPSGSPCIDEIKLLTNLQVLDLYGCGQVPDLSSLILLRLAYFRYNESVATIIGFNLNHTNLQFLDLSYCKVLQSCSGVGELVALQELCLGYCSKLNKVPNLQKLKQLRKLDVGSCSLLQSLPGLGDLVNLLELDASWCGSLMELPNMRNLKNLKILDIRFCKLIKSLPGLNELICLQSFYLLGCESLTQLPDMHKLMNLQNLELDRNGPLRSFVGLSNLISLQSLHLRINEVQDGPNLYKLTMLKRLHISGWQGQGFSSLAELVLLESIFVCNCKGMRVLPDLQRLSRLDELDLRRCEFEDMSSLSHLTSLQTLEIKDCDKLEALPNLRELVRLKELTIKRCARLKDVSGILGLRNLKRLRSSGDLWLHEHLGPDLLRPMTPLVFLTFGGGFVDQQLSTTYSQLGILTCIKCPIQELPDLANFPELFYLKVVDCVNLTKLTCTGLLSPMFRHLNVHGCMKLQALPNLTNSEEMQFLDVANTNVVLSAQFIQDMKAQWPSIDLIIE